jgi:radical SAM protein with 4Fe4S-binding SPASM domain
MKRLYRWAKGGKALPYKMIIFPTYRCNLNCPYCPFSVARKYKFRGFNELSLKEWLRVVNEGIECKIGEWRIFGGGEPMVRKDIVMGIIRAIKTYDIDLDCEIITNGTLFTKDIIEELVKLRVNRITFSIDGPSPEIHDTLRRSKGAFEKVISTLKIFREMKSKYRQLIPWIKVNMVINSKNYDKITEMVTLMHSLRCNELALHPMREEIVWKTHKTREKIHSFRLSEREKNLMRIYVEKAKILASKLSFNLNTSALEDHEIKNDKENEKALNSKFFSIFCFEPFYCIFIDPEGNAAPCNGSGKGNKKYNIKNLSLKEIWFSDYFDSVRKMLLKGELTENCLKCGSLDMTQKLKIKLSEFIREIEAKQKRAL